ncbi:MAG: IPExxxVDY family protein [Bacteroidales bacterium]
MRTKVHTISGEADFRLIGIASHLSDYKISWLFNEELHFRLSKSDDLVISLASKSGIQKFSTFKYEIESGALFTLISNRSEHAILVKDHKNLDYILKVEGTISASEISVLISKIKKLKNILTVFEIETNTLKSKELDLLGKN